MVMRTLMNLAPMGLGVVLALAGGGARAATLPLLSGSYTYTQQSFCQLGLTVTSGALTSQGGNYVQSVQSPSTSANELQLSVGTLNFVQGTTAGSGTATIAGVQAGGSTVLLTQTGTAGSGQQGAPITEQKNAGTANFTQTATKLTIVSSGETDQFSIYYGKTVAGIAQGAVFGGLDGKGCADSFTLTHR